MLLLSEVCGSQIGSWLADCLLLEFQAVNLELPFNILETEQKRAEQKWVYNCLNLISS